jgi:hypothetical protein
VLSYCAYRALFGVDPFEFDACLGLEWRSEAEPHDVAKRLTEVHKQLYSKAMKSWAVAQKQYDKAVHANLSKGLWPDIRRVFRGILGKRTVDRAVEYQVRKVGRKGFVWVEADELPDVVVNAFEVSRGDKAEA